MLNTTVYAETQKQVNSYASFIKRILAFSIDIVIVIVINTMIASAIMAVLQFLNHNSIKIIEAILPVSMSTFLAVYIFYFTLGECSKWQGTIGKKIIKIKITSTQGEKLSFPKTFIRVLVKFISIFIFFGYLTIPFTKRKQAIHDFIVNTTVVNNC